MAKEAPKGKETTAKPAQKKSEKPVASKAAKAAVKPAAAKVTKPSGKAAAKKTSAKGSKKKVSRGGQYSCEVCGLVVSVDEVCGCAEAHNIICCGEEMKAKK
jgi:hypothetical protein